MDSIVQGDWISSWAQAFMALKRATVQRVLRTDGNDLPTGGWVPLEQQGQAAGWKNTRDPGENTE